MAAGGASSVSLVLDVDVIDVVVVVDVVDVVDVVAGWEVVWVGGGRRRRKG